MNASRHVVELVGEELVQVELAVEALGDEPPALLLELAAAEPLIATVAELGLPKPAAPATEVNCTLKLLPAAAAFTGTEIVLAELSPLAQLRVPVV
jgi:hypothetical protein